MHGRRAGACVVVLLLVAALPQEALGAAAKPVAAKKKAKAKTAPPVAAPMPPPPPVVEVAPREALPAPAPVPAPAAPRVIEAAPIPSGLAPSPAPAAAPSAPVAPPAVAKPSRQVGLRVGVKFVLLVPTGRTSKATAPVDGEAVASKDVFASGALTLQYALPFLDRSLALGVEAGYYRLAGSGTRTFVNDPDFGPSLSYAWKMHAVPLLFGLSGRLPLPIPLLSLSPGVGFAAVWCQAQSTYHSPEGADVADAPQTGWALGFHVWLEAALSVGPGAVVLEGRYLNARTDLGFDEVYAGAYNADPGDVEGFNLLLGYRFEF